MVSAAYSHLGSSTLDDGLTLQTSGGPAAHPRFNTGFLTDPGAAATGLLAVAEVARRPRLAAACALAVRIVPASRVGVPA
ncbi:hypothetical protein AB0F72_22695 [Actinoplanes sp. NPDC023936]|uniref:hypothetical protein n=1 Tax=Actinoplanes sp. NPDC023936 TaxID=3154910 RepID=UPI0033CB303D